ncbi:helix-turn-helix domain-containing protein [Cohnella kolymensis]|uniref:helix-turn-helix domain-containing protein n=1 Tax=Cohnella kolymensis TaxID=1590652 RepID=UPI00137919C6|nr:AraC family transcriptional regulator [Cohnella kolymensis]
MEFAIRKAAEEIILAEFTGNIIQDHRGNSIVLLYCGERAAEEERVRQVCTEYIEACRRYFYCKISCYVGETVPITDVMNPYLVLLDAEYRNVSRTGEVIMCRNVRSSAPSLTSIVLDSLHEWSDWIEHGNQEELLAELDSRLRSISADQLTVETLTALYHAFLQCIYYVLHRKGLTASHLYQGRDWPDAAAVTKSVEHFRRWAANAVSSVISLLFTQNSLSPIVQKLKNYISEHLDQELSREELAAYVFLNPAYLSRLFRKETGMVLTNYILHEKMSKAADLLASTDQSISEIADGLGYCNFSYFARLFRKVHGVTPHDYRKSLRKTQMQ